MSAIANVVIDDGQSTPISHTYYPVKSTPIAEFRENVADVPVGGQGLLSVALTKKGSLYKVRLTAELPVMEEATAQNSSGYTAAPKVAHTVRADATLFAHARSTEDQRNDLIELFMNALGDPMFRETFKALLKPF